ncbi:MAG: hypothetical protein K6A65_08090 [Succinivibrionaceae bacterium]|nr:hypothetical protein [Succinivibrionaceae bacterium]
MANSSDEKAFLESMDQKDITFRQFSSSDESNPSYLRWKLLKQAEIQSTGISDAAAGPSNPLGEPSAAPARPRPHHDDDEGGHQGPSRLDKGSFNQKSSFKDMLRTGVTKAPARPLLGGGAPSPALSASPLSAPAKPSSGGSIADLLKASNHNPLRDKDPTPPQRPLEESAIPAGSRPGSIAQALKAGQGESKIPALLTDPAPDRPRTMLGQQGAPEQRPAHTYFKEAQPQGGSLLRDVARQVNPTPPRGLPGYPYPAAGMPVAGGYPYMAPAQMVPVAPVTVAPVPMASVPMGGGPAAYPYQAPAVPAAAPAGPGAPIYPYVARGSAPAATPGDGGPGDRPYQSLFAHLGPDARAEEPAREETLQDIYRRIESCL